jgi:hypothetical protein
MSLFFFFYTTLATKRLAFLSPLPNVSKPLSDNGVSISLYLMVFMMSWILAYSDDLYIMISEFFISIFFKNEFFRFG